VGTDFWGAEWAVTAMWTHAGKSLVAVYGQAEACVPHKYNMKNRASPAAEVVNYSNVFVTK
jgi:hypothetical protein